MTKITLLEGKNNLSALAYRPLFEIWESFDGAGSFEASPLNKGGTGQIAELLAGLNLSSDKIDFSDGELKTSGMKTKDGLLIPRETIAIATIGTRVDSLLINPQFYGSFVHEKTKNFLLAPIVQPEKQQRETWYLSDPIHIKARKNSKLYKALEEDYLFICAEMLRAAKNGERIRTTSGKYMQIRSKDTKPYHPIYSNHFKRDLADKNYAFYFKKDFIIAALLGEF